MRPLMILQSVRVKRQAGIGLLELMLALSIVAVVIILGTRYYEQTKRSQLVTQTMAQLSAIRAAMDQWEGDGNKITSVTWDRLRQGGYVSVEFGAEGSGDAKNSFGHDIRVAGHIATPNGYAVLTEVGEKPCQRMKDTLDNTTGIIEVSCSGGELTIIYALF